MAKKTPFHADLQFMHELVTGSMILVTVRFTSGNKFQFLVDAGMYQEKEFVDFNTQLFFKPENLKFILITHSHLDHVGRLPMLVKKGFCGEIYTASKNKRILGIALEDNIAIMERQKDNKRVLYNKYDLGNTLQKLCPKEHYELFNPTEYVEVRFLENGHTLGASMIYVTIKDDITDEKMNMLFTGDYINRNSLFDVRGIPDEIKDEPVTIVAESTYAKETSNQISRRFDFDTYNDLKKQNNHNLLIMSHSLQRTQDVLARINLIQKNHLIPEHVKIFVAGKLSKRYTKAFIEEGIKEQRIIPENYFDLKREDGMDIVTDKAQKVVITSSGRGDVGPASWLIPICAEIPRWKLMFTSGYVPEGSLAETIMNTKEGNIVKYAGMKFQKKTEITCYDEFSLHARGDEMLKLIGEFKDVKLVLTNHGETESKEYLRDLVVENLDVKEAIATSSQQVIRICRYGFVKAINSKVKLE